jgi:hypothetical protein
VQTSAAMARTRTTILEHLDSLQVFEDCLEEPEDVQQHHAMRIAAKRLRYTLEISDPVYEGGLAGHLKAVKQVQTLLGDVHDCDVWAEDLRAFARDERQRIAKRFGDDGPYEHLRPGIEHLAEERRARRRALFEQLVAFWGELRAGLEWERLIEMLHHEGPPAGQEPHDAPGHEPHDAPGHEPHEAREQEFDGAPEHDLDEAPGQPAAVEEQDPAAQSAARDDRPRHEKRKRRRARPLTAAAAGNGTSTVRESVGR